MIKNVICSVVNAIASDIRCKISGMENLSKDMDAVVIYYSKNINNVPKEFKFYIGVVRDEYMMFTKDIEDKYIFICSVNEKDISDTRIASEAIELVNEISRKVCEVYI